jgi:hypothetical protein
MECKRCNKEINTWTLSMFNTDEICIDCKHEEMKLPEYEEAVRAELEEVKKGNYNFKGIGYPVKK